MTFTIFGATGFVGSHLVRDLKARGHKCIVPERDEIPVGKDLGCVIYCIGLTSDFRSRPAATVEAHVCHLVKILTSCSYEQFCYLSSTRMYLGQSSTLESTPIAVSPSNPHDIFSISKLMGESACLNISDKTVVVRPSNIFDFSDTSGNFLNAVIDEATTGSLTLRTTLDSEKDYILLSDVVAMIPVIATQGTHRIYNLASGRNTTHQEIVRQLNCEVTVAPNAATIQFPRISIERLQDEFGFQPDTSLLKMLKEHSNTNR